MKNSPEPRKKQKVAAMLWYNQGDAAAGLMKTRGATAAAVAELEQRSDDARRKRESVRRKCWAGLFIRQSHKWARDSRRPRRGYLPLTAPRFSE